MPSNRQEHDSLGVIEVPGDALYGAQTQRAINNFPISGLMMPRNFIQALGLMKFACARVNHRINKMDKGMSDAIVEAALAVATGQYDSHFPVDVFQTGSGTSSNMNANEVIASLASQTLGAPVHPNDHVNMGQSSNDVIPSCIHLAACLDIKAELIPALECLLKSIDTKSTALQADVKTGRTHLMDAMPLTFGQELSGWAQQIRNSIIRIDSSMIRLHELAIGATAVGTGVNAAPDFGLRVVEVLNEKTTLGLTVKPNYFEALSCQDTALELSGHLNTLAASLMKISNDLRWMSSGPYAGLNEVKLPALQPGSSIMPGKVNPVIPEAVCMIAAQVMGNHTTITVAAQSGSFQLNTMLPVIAYNLLQSIHIASNGARVLAEKAIDGLSVNQDTINAVVERNPILVTALNELIGYEQCAEIAKRAYQQGRPVLDVAKELTDVDIDTLTRLLDPKNLTGNL